jgi:hypothetical protein
MRLSKLVSSRRSTIQKGYLFSMTALSIAIKTQISELLTFSILALSIMKLNAECLYAAWRGTFKHLIIVYVNTIIV